MIIDNLVEITALLKLSRVFDLMFEDLVEVLEESAIATSVKLRNRGVKIP
ncbi:hypothetical protein [Microseira wollei]|nr:hypothetical protein [Microseira wollei]